MESAILALPFAFAALTACANTDLSDIDTSNAEPACTRECTAHYSECAQGGPAIGSNAQTLKACKEGLRMCISTCPRTQLGQYDQTRKTDQQLSDIERALR